MAIRQLSFTLDSRKITIGLKRVVILNYRKSRNLLVSTMHKLKPKPISPVAALGVTLCSLILISAIVSVNANDSAFGNLDLGGFNLTNGTSQSNDSGSLASTDNMANTDNKKALSQIQGADILTLQTFQTSPFKSGVIKNEQKFEALERDLSIQNNYSLFQKAASEVLTATGLCSGSSSSASGSTKSSGVSRKSTSSVAKIQLKDFISIIGVKEAHAGTVEEQLKNCANSKPDEFAAVSNMIRSYFEWQNTELRTVMQYYQNKIVSPVLRDRIEGRLVSECLRTEMATKDTAGAMNTCRDPKNWPVQKTFYASCSNGKNSAGQSGVFQYKKYVADCVMSNIVKESVGSGLFFEMLPDFQITVSQTGVVTETSPITATPASAFFLIYEQTYAQISSEWFANFATQGCLPSVFAPKEFAQLVIDKDPKAANYYSICLPQKLVQRINALPRLDAEFYLSIIAKRVTAIQVAELLNGSVLIAEETHRNLMAADREIGSLVETYPRYIGNVSKMYLDQLNLVNSKKLDDVLEKIESLFEKYQKEVSSLDSGHEKFAKEVKRAKERSVWNE